VSKARRHPTADDYTGPEDEVSLIASLTKLFKWTALFLFALPPAGITEHRPPILART
jgi:hypothetical protein